MYQLSAECNRTTLCPLEFSSCRTTAMLTQWRPSRGTPGNLLPWQQLGPCSTSLSPARSNRIVLKRFLGEQYEKVYIDNIVGSRHDKNEPAAIVRHTEGPRMAPSTSWLSLLKYLVCLSFGLFLDLTLFLPSTHFKFQLNCLNTY